MLNCLHSECPGAEGTAVLERFQGRNTVESQWLDLGGWTGKKCQFGWSIEGNHKVCARDDYAWLAMPEKMVMQDEKIGRIKAAVNPSYPVTRHTSFRYDVMHGLAASALRRSCSFLLHIVSFCANSFLLRSQICCSPLAFRSPSSDRGSFLSHSYLISSVLSTTPHFVFTRYSYPKDT